jgi:Zinc-binding dehydrogenase
VLDRLASGKLKPIIAKTFPLVKIVDAHQFMESNEQIGKSPWTNRDPAGVRNRYREPTITATDATPEEADLMAAAQKSISVNCLGLCSKWEATS